MKKEIKEPVISRILAQSTLKLTRMPFRVVWSLIFVLPWVAPMAIHGLIPAAAGRHFMIIYRIDVTSFLFT